MFPGEYRERNRARSLLAGYSSEANERPSAELENGISAGEFEQTLVYAGLDARQKRSFKMRLAVVLAIGIVLSLLTKSPIPLIVAGVWLFFEMQRIRRKAASRAEKFERDYTAFLLSLASGVKTGSDPLTVLVKSYRLFPKESVISAELKRLEELVDSGLSEEEVVRQFAASISHPDISLFRSAFILSRKEGSSLSVCLHRLARVTRQRQSFRRKIRSAVAMQKLSAIGIALCTLIITAIQGLTNPDAILTALKHPVGVKALTFGVLLIITGLVWMLKLANRRV
ncbi:MAG: hypothetical protein D6719_10315 [Candidatus Dadabacteria bacterium]|nr:MAG: hypothetical protein D6719_10315 [Candidatus Dadabacteria bacterium]